MKRILSILIFAFICAATLSDCHSEELRESSVITYASVVELTESCPASSMYINTSRQSSSVPMARRVVSQHKHCKITALAEQSQPKDISIYISGHYNNQNYLYSTLSLIYRLRNIRI
ncbi:MAG: hypothetical protein IIX42_05750 [Alistipes sp.]|nr:hypothetical protein [Alistipes sp.]